MEDKALISQLKGLKQIEPSNAWVVSVRKQIVGEQEKTSFLNVFPVLFSAKKLAYASLTLILFVLGTLGFAQYTVPGDFLFPVKKITESQASLLSGVNQTRNNLDIASRRLDDLTSVVRDNKTANLASAMQEMKDSIGEAVRSLSVEIKDNPGSLRQVAMQVKQIEDKKKDLETLGVVMQNNEMMGLNNVLIILLQGEIASLDNASLNEDQQKELQEIKELYFNADYSEALEKVLMIGGGN